MDPGDEPVWQFQRDGRTFGPVSVRELTEMLGDGATILHTPVRRVGETEWRTLQIALRETWSSENADASTDAVGDDGRLNYFSGRAVTVEMRYAAFWLRFVALLVDWLVIIVPLIIILMVIGLTGIADRVPQVANAFYAIATLGTLFYFPMMEASRRQATIGKSLLGLYVTNLNGEPINLVQGFGRLLAKYVSALPLYIGFIVIGFTQRKQGFHDMLAGTLVLRR